MEGWTWWAPRFEFCTVRIRTGLTLTRSDTLVTVLARGRCPLMANSTSPTGGRPLGFEPAQTLDRVVETFWVNGYEATTTVLLEEATGLSRSSLLNTFGPKEKLLLAAVDRYQAMTDNGLLDPMLNGSRGLADLDRFFVALGVVKASAPGSSGCLVVNLGALTDLTPGLRERVDRYYERL